MPDPFLLRSSFAPSGLDKAKVYMMAPHYSNAVKKAVARTEEFKKHAGKNQGPKIFPSGITPSIFRHLKDKDLTPVPPRTPQNRLRRNAASTAAAKNKQAEKETRGGADERMSKEEALKLAQATVGARARAKKKATVPVDYR